MTWQDDRELELRRAREAAAARSAGKARTSVRRAVGVAVTELEKSSPGKRYGVDVMSQVRGRAEDQGVPIEVRKAAERLQARLAADLTSPSQVPLSDSDIIFGYIKRRLDL
jgi:hypothetical protein